MDEARFLRDHYRAVAAQRTVDGTSAVKLAAPTTSQPWQSTPTQYTSQSSANWPGKIGALSQYPNMPKVPDDKPLLPSLGATGTAIFSGIITDNGEYNPDFFWRDGLEIYERMRRNDAQIRAVIKMMELPLRRATWTIEPFSDDPRDEEIASFVETCLFHDMRYTSTEGRIESQSWDDILRHALLMLTFGFSVFEQVWRIEDGWVKWARWTPLLPKTIWRWWVGEDNELVGVQQWTFKNYGYVFVDIPADKLILFSYDREGNNYAGISPLRSAYKHWYYKENFEKIDAIGIERNAVVPPIIHLPENATTNDIAAAQQIVQNMRANELMGVTLPFGWDLEYPKNEQKYAANVIVSIQYHDVMIARNMLAQFLNLGSTETGAYALADSQIRTFLQAEQAVAEQIEGVINGEPIKRLVDYNYNGVKGYPKLKCSKVALSDATDLAKSLGELVNMPTPLITPDADLEDYLRDQMGLPKAARGVVQGTNPTAPSDPARPENANANDHSDQQPQDKNPTDQQQAVSQAKASGIVTDPLTAKGQPAGTKTAAETLASETRMLREALETIRVLTDHDAVAGAETWREQSEAMVLFNPNHDSKGRFAPGSGGGATKGGAGKAAGGGAKASKATKAPAAPKAKASGGGGASAETGNAAPKGGKAKKAPAEATNDLATRAAAVPTAASRLRGLDDAHNAEQAWHAFGANWHSVRAVLQHEPTGALEAMARNRNLPGAFNPRLRSRDTIVDHIVERMDAAWGKGEFKARDASRARAAASKKVGA
jgi:hypothetical protein